MFSSMFKATASSLCQPRSFRAFQTMTASEFTDRYTKIWENEELALLNPRAGLYVRDRICVAGEMVWSGEKVENVVKTLKESIKGMLVWPESSSPLLKHYTSFMEKLDHFTDLVNVPGNCKSAYLRKGFEHLYVHPLLWPLRSRTHTSFACLWSSHRNIEVAGPTEKAPGLINTPKILASQYYNMCSGESDPERYHYLKTDLSGIKNETIKDTFRRLENPPMDFRFVAPIEVLKVYHTHTAHFDERKIEKPIILSKVELHEDLGLVMLDCWDYGVAKGIPENENKRSF